MTLQPADILLVNSSGILGTVIDVITDSPWCHAAIIADPERRLGIEAQIFRQVDYRPIDDFLGDALVLRYPKLTRDQQNKILQYVKAQIGTEYDYAAILKELLRYGFGIPPQSGENHGRFICSTLITNAYLSVGIQLTDQPLASPDDLFLSDKVVVAGRLGIDL
ncbi:YiiX/YebB-like N1pC/P60 family cysteine hydrolase [Lihuaxuella thermophila]|uniref:Permuted papain-like amidase enzyme, YaeF/YiiX, C92 family n=1 Tax=Lihuaxuella thermophila TaxID=1173111 RepID=A0A1H8H3D0_9BACL|nr:YiiX/YebB-like N1pC/P60 family cysteine hydrolase [Lihuaxuella thermophila]SEN50881.1 Permuted papain-like amidase enzyme, YaeF/YiiX, C92 family [Lihuaxuella thermophila]